MNKVPGNNSAKNRSFTTSIRELGNKTNRAQFILNSKVKPTELPVMISIKIFRAIISPILQLFPLYCNYFPYIAIISPILQLFPLYCNYFPYIAIISPIL